jgi:hypothetical protein
MFYNIKGNSDGMCNHMANLRPSVNDFSNKQELESFFKAFYSSCVISGIAGNKIMLSPDRKIDSTGRYNWTDSMKFFYENKVY